MPGPYHPAHLKSTTFELEERVYRDKLKRTFILLWLTVGNVLVGMAVVGWLIFVRFKPPLQGFVVAVGFLFISIVIASIALYRRHLVVRDGELELRKVRQLAREYQLEAAEEAAKDGGTTDGDALLMVHKRYREDIPEVVESFRRESNRNRRKGNLFQNVIIVGSLLASSATTSSVYYEPARWVAVVLSLLVAIAAGFISYYKYRERSFNLQQAADSIERNYYSVELRAGRYAVAGDEKAAYRIFVNEVESLREEQSKRQQQLEQPVEVKQEQQA